MTGPLMFRSVIAESAAGRFRFAVVCLQKPGCCKTSQSSRAQEQERVAAGKGADILNSLLNVKRPDAVGGVLQMTGNHVCGLGLHCSGCKGTGGGICRTCRGLYLLCGLGLGGVRCFTEFSCHRGLGLAAQTSSLTARLLFQFGSVRHFQSLSGVRAPKCSAFCRI
ncbi:hypothetical protein K3725_08395 [Leisingera sp. S132]|uniref:hypothetical protein n=1 Tax=Leisingera sp. S132 TaxID=2867016 RepID=UPI0021A3A87E|nr:hypothetical protein [Leisingera sp. S132]UWQ81000.1 hypothetical protein K3725_08395 [Leisingera sp. S132]